jgi:UDP-GlcNAc3NAcA epimerase
LCPTQTAIDNLDLEGYKNIDTNIVKCGDVMQDAANFYAKRSVEKSTVIKENGLKDYILTTLHRAENTDDVARLKDIVEALNEIHNTICPIVLPLHPRTKKKLEQFGLKLNVTLIEPVGYFDMIELIKNSKLVMTDSGGLQKEAFFFEKNCVTMRDQTEWVELIKADVNVLVGADKLNIIKQANVMLSKASDFSVDLYGNGFASKNIVEYLLNN